MSRRPAPPPQRDGDSRAGRGYDRDGYEGGRGGYGSRDWDRPAGRDGGAGDLRYDGGGGSSSHSSYRREPYGGDRDDRRGGGGRDGRDGRDRDYRGDRHPPSHRDYNVQPPPRQERNDWDREDRYRRDDGDRQRRRHRDRSESPARRGADTRGDRHSGRTDEEEPRGRSKQKDDTRAGDVGSGQGQAEGGEGDEDEEAMMAAMGFGGFGSTKGSKVNNNQEGAAYVKKERTWRQYMQRKGGFNRPLSPVRKQ